MKKTVSIALLVFISLGFSACKKDKDDPSKNDRSLNLFTLQNDKDLGLQVSEQIESDSSGYTIMEPADYPVAYSHLDRIINNILASGKVKYKDDFVWRTRLIKDDSTLNAFCAPGGYIYVFTGIIKYLDSEDQLAGVLGHEIAHADRRHSTDQMTKQYGYSFLIGAILGDKSALTKIATGLVLLKYGRENESEADEYSVRYLCPTTYNSAGGAGFFEKIAAAGGSRVPEFLSTHPSPENRIPEFYRWQKELDCTGTDTRTTEYQAFINSLP